MKTGPLLELATRIASDHNIAPKVVHALITVESAWNTWAVRFEPGWKYTFDIPRFAQLAKTSQDTEKTMQSTSWGLMQVMGTVARELGHVGPLPELCTPRLGIVYGCKKLALCLKKYPLLPEALAAYNAGTPGTAAGKSYSDKVIALLG